MKGKISVLLLAPVLLLGLAGSAQALSFTESFSDPIWFEYENNTFEFESSLAETSSILPNYWKIEVELEDNMGIGSEFVAQKPSKIEDEFDSFELSGGSSFGLLADHNVENSFSFFGVIKDIPITQKKRLKSDNQWYFYGEFVYDGDSSDEKVIAFISNSKPESSAPVPEPATMVLMGAGMLGLAAVRRRQKK